MEEDNLTTPSLPDGAPNVPSPGGTVAESEVASLKDVLNTALGKDFPSDEAALKAVKDTFNFVGKKTEPQVVEKTVVPDEITSKLSSLEAQLQETSFYAQNPELNNDDFKALVKLSGKSPSELAGSEDFKTQYDKIKAYNEIEKSKSVLQSNSRLGQVTDKITQAREALQSGNQTVAESNAVSAVIEAYDLTR